MNKQRKLWYPFKGMSIASCEGRCKSYDCGVSRELKECEGTVAERLYTACMIIVGDPVTPRLVCFVSLVQFALLPLRTVAGTTVCYGGFYQSEILTLSFNHVRLRYSICWKVCWCRVNSGRLSGSRASEGITSEGEAS